MGLLSRSQKGGFISTDEWNTVKHFIQAELYKHSGQILQRYATEPLEVKTEALGFDPYSLFSITVVDSERHYHIPRLIAKPTATTSSNGALNLFYTNRSTAIPSYSRGHAYLIADNTPAFLQCDPNTNDIPQVGKTCGPIPGTGLLSRHYTGFICLSTLITTPTGDYQWFALANTNTAFAGEVTEQITAFDSDTDLLGKGKIKVHYKQFVGPTPRDFDAYFIKDPSDIGIEYEVDVWNLSPYTILIGKKVTAKYVAGMGLLVSPEETMVNDLCTVVSAVNCLGDGEIQIVYTNVAIADGKFTCEIDRVETCFVGAGGGSQPSSSSSVSVSSSSGGMPSSSTDIVDPELPCHKCVTSNSDNWEDIGTVPPRYEDEIDAYDSPVLTLEGDGTDPTIIKTVGNAVPAREWCLMLRYRHTLDPDMLSDDFLAADWFTNRLDTDFDSADFHNLDFLQENSVFGQISIYQGGSPIITVPLAYRAVFAPEGSQVAKFLGSDYISLFRDTNGFSTNSTDLIEIRMQGPTERGINLQFDALKFDNCVPLPSGGPSV